MPLTTGTRLGSYEVVVQIGAGGMGEVYQAHDTKLGREVAIKVLPQALEQDAERLARFQREAKMLAALNHPNIATIHGLEYSGSTHYLVMELVPGETLADRIKRDGAVPVEEALTICKHPPKAPELPKRLTGEETAWGSSGKEAGMLLKFRGLFARMEVRDRQLLLSMAQKMSRR